MEFQWQAYPFVSTLVQGGGRRVRKVGGTVAVRPFRYPSQLAIQPECSGLIGPQGPDLLTLAGGRTTARHSLLAAASHLTQWQREVGTSSARLLFQERRRRLTHGSDNRLNQVARLLIGEVRCTSGTMNRGATHLRGTPEAHDVGRGIHSGLPLRRKGLPALS